jgi:hypothetical protein
VEKVLFLLVGLLLICAACGAERRTFVAVDLPKTYEIPEYLPWEDLGIKGNARLFLTKEQATADFDYMWAMLHENAPFLKLVDDHAQYLGFDLEDVERNALSARERLNQRAIINLEEFFGILQGSFGALAGSGHLALLPPEMVHSFQDTCRGAQRFVEHEDTRALYGNMLKVLNAKKVQEAYAYLGRLPKDGAESGAIGKTGSGITLSYCGETDSRASHPDGAVRHGGGSRRSLRVAQAVDGSLSRRGTFDHRP